MNTTRLPIIQSLWVSKELTPLSRLSLASYVYHGHEVHLYTYGEVAGVPAGVKIMDANAIIAEKYVFRYPGDWFGTGKGSYAIFADWFRFALLHRYGHFWSDMDMVCLKPLVFDADIVFGAEDAQHMCTAVMGFPKEHPLCALLEQVCADPSTPLPYDNTRAKLRKLYRKLRYRGERGLIQSRMHQGWGECAGPRGFSAALRHFGLFEQGQEQSCFYPVSHQDWRDLFFNESMGPDAPLLRQTYAIHFWNEALHRGGGDLNGTFPEQGLFSQLCKRYLP